MRIQVAVGLIFNSIGEVLIAKRQSHQHLGGCWEFPGGKIESGESVSSALKRELQEEIGIDVLAHESWFQIEHDYENKAVCLNVHKILSYHGEPKGCEGQQVLWLAPTKLSDFTFPKANEAIVHALLNS